jgi:hypothetical protein
MAIERDKLQHELTIAFDQFMEAFAAIHERSINVKPVPQSWTPIQVALHIIMATDGLPDTTTKVLDREPDYYLAFIRPWWEDLSQKFDSPEYLKSGIEPHTKQQILTELYRMVYSNAPAQAHPSTTKHDGKIKHVMPLLMKCYAGMGE